MSYQYHHIATLDGITVYNEVDPNLALDTGQDRLFALDLLGKYHILRFSTPLVDQTFQLKSLLIDGNVAGRL